MLLALLALTISAFAIGTAQFVIVGLIPTIADKPPCEPAVRWFLGEPLRAHCSCRRVRTDRTDRPRAAQDAARRPYGLFSLGNRVAWWVPSYETLIAARVLTRLAHGVFFSVGSIIATNLVPKEKATSAIATMFSGMTVAFVTGIPLGTIVAGFGLVALVGSLWFVPNDIQNDAPVPLLKRARVPVQPRLLLVYAMGYGGSLIAFIYLAPILEIISGFSPSFVGAVLQVYGISVAFGNVWGGKLADKRGPVFALKVIFGLLAVVLLVLTFIAPSKPLVLLTVLVWGAVAFANVSALQVYGVMQAERFAPGSANVASGLNIAAFSLSVAGGSAAGRQIGAHLELSARESWQLR
ncbi:Drug efflux protein [Caballeronia sordidicola]|uniref:Drug efflux protein n=1 Tax=Caballeronia sordidicola TaxID=196367 RepID=A0A226WX39_CABSO|nr:Drug efflux protein [Caballeronia sordidicola]